MPVSTLQLTNLPNLGPGSTGENVRVLQQWLVENGYLTQAQMNTGPGIYGPKTKAAVAAWQAKAGFDTQGNPGYFGPLSKQYLQGTVKPAPAPAPAPPTPKVKPKVKPEVKPEVKLEVKPEPEPKTDITTPPIGKKFQESDAYKSLSADLRGLVDLAFSSFTGTPEEQQIFADALTRAQALADPYSKAQLAFFKGEFESKIAFSQGDLERASLATTTARDEIREITRVNKEFLTLEQQADLAREETKYSSELLDIADQAAEKGLTFATGARSRVLAEERRGKQFQDVIQSTQRKTNLQLKELELRATRGETDAAQQLADIKARSSFQLESIGRSAEKVLGTTRAAPLAGATGYTPVGGVLGDIEQERRKAIIDAASLAIPK